MSKNSGKDFYKEVIDEKLSQNTEEQLVLTLNITKDSQLHNAISDFVFRNKIQSETDFNNLMIKTLIEGMIKNREHGKDIKQSYKLL